MEYSEELAMNFYHESKSFLLDFISGSIAGVAVTLTGHPFDTIKVRMQRDVAKDNKKTFLANIKQCFHREGVLGFYKGMSFPLYSVPLINAVVFSIHELSKKMLGFHNEMEMKMHEGILCGGIAGLFNCVVVTPVELVKVRLQIQQESKVDAFYKGVLDCIKKTYLENGLRGLYKGTVATILREIPAYAAQFGGYCYSKQLMAKYYNKNANELNNFQFMLCGAVGGYFCWQFSYPQDMIKTLLQTNTNGYKSICFDGGFLNCGKYIYKTQGLMGFWRGYLPCTLRALIANAVLFMSYENSKKALKEFVS